MKDDRKPSRIKPGWQKSDTDKGKPAAPDPKQPNKKKLPDWPKK
jgi:hypothetical protein